MTLQIDKSALRDAVMATLDDRLGQVLSCTGGAPDPMTGRVTVTWDTPVDQPGVEIADDGAAKGPGLDENGFLPFGANDACICNFSGIEQTYRLLVCNDGLRDMDIFILPKPTKDDSDPDPVVLGSVKRKKCAIVTVTLKDGEKFGASEKGRLKRSDL